MYNLRQNLTDINDTLASASFEDLQDTQIQAKIAVYLK